MKTTDYGMAGPVNEFGVEKPAKDVNFLHTPGAGLTGTKLPVSRHYIRYLICEFFEANGVAPKILRVSGPTLHHKAMAIEVPGLGIIPLDIEYGAGETHVE